MNIDIQILSQEERKALLKELLEARFSGVKRVKFDDRDVEFKSDDEMKTAIKDLQDSISTSPKRRNVVVASFSSGF
ncbi:phage head-tail joining protein [Pseudovibrio ascidiaceicola]|uniref:phage head-tail joining protein n=1 Tax=Pseudovibrio ascidiaceicola TaxID=285279 RepID=UPI003D369A18